MERKHNESGITVEDAIKELWRRYNKSALDDRLRMNYERGRRSGLEESANLLREYFPADPPNARRPD